MPVGKLFSDLNAFGRVDILGPVGSNFAAETGNTNTVKEKDNISAKMVVNDAANGR